MKEDPSVSLNGSQDGARKVTVTQEGKKNASPQKDVFNYYHGDVDYQCPAGKILSFTNRRF